MGLLKREENSPADDDEPDPADDNDPKVVPPVVDEDLPPSEDDDDGDDQWDKERGMKTIRKLREDLKTAKRETAALKPEAERAKALDREKLSDSEKLQAEAAEAKLRVEQMQRKVRTVTLEGEVRRHAAAMNFIDEDVAIALVGAYDIQFDDDDRPIGIEDALKEIAKNKPKLVVVEADRPPRRQVPGAPKPTSNATPEEVSAETKQKHLATGRYAL